MLRGVVLMVLVVVGGRAGDCSGRKVRGVVVRSVVVRRLLLLGRQVDVVRGGRVGSCRGDGAGGGDGGGRRGGGGLAPPDAVQLSAQARVVAEQQVLHTWQQRY